MKKVLALASGGGHWKQLMTLRGAFKGKSVVYATTIDGLAEQSGIDNSYLLPDASLTEKLKLIVLFFHVLWLVIRVRPDFVISTGAAPGFFAILCGRMIGAKTLWVDSIANGTELSKCGKYAQKVAHTTLSQWPSLADDKNVFYHGSVL